MRISRKFFLSVFVASLIFLASSGNSYAQSKGALTNFGEKWGWTGTNEAFVPQLVMYANPDRFYNNPSKIDSDINTFIKEHGFNGFHVGVACRWFNLNEADCRNISGGSPVPDQRTIDALKMLIQKTHAAGGMVHIWMWGDSSRGQNPSVRSDWGGLMGSVDKRLQDKIAVELGPLDGWSIGYGFDLDEWVSASKLKEWRDYLQGKLPKFHFLGGRPAGPNSGTDHSAYISWNTPMDYSSYEHHRPSYDVYVAAFNAVPGQPVISEDRFRIRDGGYPDKDYDEEMTRRGLWSSGMAGGVANIWGYLKSGGSSDGGSASYPNKDQIKTYSRFFESRFKKDMSRCGSLTSGGGRCLKRTNNHDYVFYKESASSIQMDLSGMAGSQPAIAVDTKKPYSEIDIGTLQVKNQTWTAPYSSDWAVAVGAFGVAQPSPTATPTPTGIPGDLDKDGDVDIFDYNVLIENFGATNCGNIADIDGNCKVDIFDYNILVENFGKTS